MLSSVLLFLNIGGGEMILIVFVALMLFGGNKLPEIARGLGKGIRDFKDASEDVKREINNQINNYEEKKPEKKAEVIEEEPATTAEEERPSMSLLQVPCRHTKVIAATDAIEERKPAEDATYEHDADVTMHHAPRAGNTALSTEEKLKKSPLKRLPKESINRDN
jgi:sec-independent protein translocase protein TatA